MNSSAETPLLRAGQPARSHWLMFTGLGWLIPMVQCACSAILFIQGLIWENRGVYFGIFPIDGSNFSNWSDFLHTCCSSGPSGGEHSSPLAGVLKGWNGSEEKTMSQHLEVRLVTVRWAQGLHRKLDISLIKSPLFLLSKQISGNKIHTLSS